MQLKEKPELNQINQKSEASVKTYQPDRPIKERKSVAKNYQPDLQPIKERKSVATTDRQHLRPIKNRKSVATTDRQDLRPIKNRKSVAKTYQPHFRPIKEHKSGGGTLRIIELSLVPIILTILSAIALPEFAKCNGTLAKQSEAKQYLSSMNRAQQANHAEYSAFSNSITALGIGIKTQTTNYNYSAIATKNAAFSYGVARSNNLRSYVGAVFLVPVSPAANDAKTTVSILCAANSPGKTQPPNPILENDVPVCAAGTEPLTK
jgi:type IV pilus assembly protein PilA